MKDVTKCDLSCSPSLSTLDSSAVVPKRHCSVNHILPKLSDIAPGYIQERCHCGSSPANPIPSFAINHQSITHHQSSTNRQSPIAKQNSLSPKILTFFQHTKKSATKTHLPKATSILRHEAVTLTVAVSERVVSALVDLDTAVTEKLAVRAERVLRQRYRGIAGLPVAHVV